MKTSFVTLFAVGISLGALSQQNWCGFDSQNAKLNVGDPSRELSIHEQLLRITQGQYTPGTDRSDPIIIPVVVHVIHDGGSGNISYEQIQSGIDMLNEDYNRMNADAINTRNTSSAPFEPIAATVGIQFELAKLDPFGQCTNGVERRYSPATTNNAANNAKHYNQGGLDAWPRSKYMNIWVVNSIESDGGGVTLGYAEFPYSGGSSNYGVIIRHDAYGTVGTASGDRTLSHEIGHCLGLFHTFQGGCHSDDCSGNGDYCCDTPPESEAHWSCGSGQNSCPDIPTNDLYGFDALDQWENFMSYAPCQNMFSSDQKNIMLTNLSDISFLSNLVSLSNQTATGVGQAPQLCKAEFASNMTVVCAGSSVNFYDQSYFNISGHSWSFAGGSPAVSTDANPIVVYDTPGVYDVSLSVTDGSSTTSTSTASYIVVLPNPGVALPYAQGFESFTSLPDNQEFLVQNDDEQQTWEIASGVSFTGNKCVKLENFGESGGSKDALISGPIDLSSLTTDDTLVFNFRYAYSKKSSDNDEWLRIYVSKDCGETWILRKNLHGNTLSTQVQNSAYEPQSQTEWKFASVTNINSDYFVSNFRFKFEFENDNGNNIYLDNINIYPVSMTGIDANENFHDLSVYPNPASTEIRISYNASADGSIQIYLTDATGKISSDTYSGSIISGANTWILPVEGLAPGIYFVHLISAESQETLRIIIE